jgi:four helix bundle protein
MNDVRRQAVGDGRGIPSQRTGEGLYKFQRLGVYQLALEYVDLVYTLAHLIPDSERFNLRPQLQRAATSIVLNIAEGSTGQTDAEQRRFLGLALRSYVETVACFDLLERRRLLKSAEVEPSRQLGHQLFMKLQAMRRALKERQPSGNG